MIDDMLDILEDEKVRGVIALVGVITNIALLIVVLRRRA